MELQATPTPNRDQHNLDHPGPELDPDEDPAERCLARLLRSFFPTHVGEGNRRQARPYIRSSAVGRGSLPAGSPRAKDLIAALEALGFVDGGRRGHLYAPWSPAVGRKAPGLRSEISSYLRDGSRGPSVEALLDRIRRAGHW
jgi:hypothetical protein